MMSMYSLDVSSKASAAQLPVGCQETTTAPTSMKAIPFIKIDEAYARLPGAGYAALHSELKDVDPEDYPDIHKMSILADVAPYSREYHTFRKKVSQQAQGNTELEIEYEKDPDPRQEDA